MLKQRWTNFISTPCLQGNCLETFQENIHNRVEGCNLSKIIKLVFIALYLMKLPKLPKSVIPPRRLPKSTFKKVAQIKCITNTTKALLRHILTNTSENVLRKINNFLLRLLVSHYMPIFDFINGKPFLNVHIFSFLT